MNTPNSFKKYVNYAQLVAQIGFCSTTFFCSILIFLTIFGVKRSFGSYTYLLILFSFVGIFFATCELILYPNVYSHNCGYVFWTTNTPFNLGKDAITWFMSFYTGIYASTIAMISVQFLYRYWAIFDETKLRFFKGWRFLVCVAYSLGFGVQWSVGLYYFIKIDDYSRNYMRDEMMEKYEINISDVPVMALVAYDDVGNVRWWNLLCTINETLVMFIQYAVIFYCAISMYTGMEEKLQMLSVSLRNMHKQFFKTLILQILTPTVTLFTPVTIIMYLPVLNLNVDLPSGVFFCAFTLYPAMDAIIVMCIVTDYRKAAKSLLKKHVEKCHIWLNSTKVESTMSRPISGAAINPAA